MKLAGYRLAQRDGYSCGPTVAVVAAALLDRGYRQSLQAGPQWFAAEQTRVHRAANRIWPRRLGMTPCAVAAAVNTHSPVRYRWRCSRGLLPGGVDRLIDVLAAVEAGRPVPMLIGRVIPRHWVLIVEVTADRLCCFDPGSGQVRTVSIESVRRGRLSGLGFPRPFAFVLAGRHLPRCVA